MDSILADNFMIIGSVFLTSFLGSLHCVGMCGPIVLVLGNNKVSLFLYHMGRLMSYLLLGVLAYALGGVALAPFAHSTAALISPLSLGLVFLWMAVRSFQKKSFHFKVPQKLSKVFSYFVGEVHQGRRQYFGRFLVGLFSFALPCGWLYGVVIGATTTNNVLLSLFMMFAFWLGTIPLLILAPTIIKKIIGPVSEKVPYITGCVFLFAALALFFQVFKRF